MATIVGSSSNVLSGKVAAVTGANRGLGREIALSLAAAGARVAISARATESLDETRTAIERLGVEAFPIKCDVADESSTAHFGSLVLAHFGKVDVVVANAGIAGPTKPAHEITYEEWRECLVTDLDGVYLTFRAFLPAMIDARQGSLIAVSSMTGKRPLPGRTPYATAKMGVIGLVRTLAMELGPFGIRANCVCPGAVEGPRIQAVIAGQAAQQGISEGEAARQFTLPSALHRLVQPSEIGAACVFLASPSASGITGEDLNVSAGLVMY